MANRVLYRNKYLILDGYNVINQWDDLKRLASHSLQSARDELVEILVNHIAFTGEQAYLVFDAYSVKSGQPAERQIMDRGLNVVFTKENQTADSYIECFVESIAGSRNNFVRVVTSDWAEQQIVLGSGGIRVSPREFKAEIANIKSRIEKTHENRAGAGNTLSDILDKNLFEKLERMRRE